MRGGTGGHDRAPWASLGHPTHEHAYAVRNMVRRSWCSVPRGGSAGTRCPAVQVTAAVQLRQHSPPRFPSKALAVTHSAVCAISKAKPCWHRRAVVQPPGRRGRPRGACLRRRASRTSGPAAAPGASECRQVRASMHNMRIHHMHVRGSDSGCGRAAAHGAHPLGGAVSAQAAGSYQCRAHLGAQDAAVGPVSPCPK